VAISPHPPTGRPVRLLLHSQFGLGVSCEVSRFDHTGWEVFYKSRDPEIRYGALSLPSSCSSVLPEPLYDTRDIRSFFIIYKGHGRKRLVPRYSPRFAVPSPGKTPGNQIWKGTSAYQGTAGTRIRAEQRILTAWPQRLESNGNPAPNQTCWGTAVGIHCASRSNAQPCPGPAKPHDARPRIVLTAHYFFPIPHRVTPYLTLHIPPTWDSIPPPILASSPQHYYETASLQPKGDHHDHAQHLRQQRIVPD
jgi:hypothetical protein